MEGDYFYKKNPELLENRIDSHRLWIVLGLCGLFGVSTIFLVSSFPNSFFSAKSLAFESEDEFEFTLIRDGYEMLPYFSTDLDYLRYSVLDDIQAVIEPMAPMKFSYLDSSDMSSDASSIGLTVCEDSEDQEEEENCVSYQQDLSDSIDSPGLQINCAPHSTYTMRAVEMSSEGERLRTSSATAKCLYVRREIRELTEDDLAAAMDAMYVLWTLTDEEGQALYGEEFHNASYFAAAHHFNSAQRDSDHYHEGLGFLPQHIKLSNIFEQSVQTVDPSFALPYWDFTIDVAENLTIFESFMFTSDTFGSLPKPTDAFFGYTYKYDSLDDAVIPDGRWKGQKADVNTRYPSALGNSFGYMRGPWNMNPSPYLTRFPSYDLSLPSCGEYYGGLTMTDFMLSLKNARNGPHASTHGLIGGVYGCDALDDYTESGIIRSESTQRSMCEKWGFYLKELWRKGLLEPRTDCSASSLDEDDVDCGFTCTDGNLDDLTEELEFLINGNYVKSGMKTADWESLGKFICHGNGFRIFVGDHLESASSFDPSFWPIHPTQERLLQLKFMSGSSFSDEDWPTNATADYVCDKSTCLDSESGIRDAYETCCFGHFQFDQLMDFTTGDASGRFGLTNDEILKMVNPSSPEYSVSYIYNHFEWSHCEDDFEVMATLLFEQSLSDDSPSYSPTPLPAHSYAPTAAPVVQHTYNPTPEPTTEPTAAPSRSLAPTAAPVVEHTYNPTPEPTTAAPSRSLAPTAAPVVEHTCNPTPTGTYKPSI